jgi:xanthine phosphoribosyltransferase
MKLLEDKIRADGIGLGTEIVKVDSFLNHQIDVGFIRELGLEFARLFGDCGVTKILTMESSGIAIAFATAAALGDLPLVFAKKSATNTMEPDFYAARVRSFTRGETSTARVARKFLSAQDQVLIIDDFLAHGEAALGLVSIVEQAGAKLVGLGVVIEKQFQGGGERLRERGLRLESLAVVEKIENGQIIFAK